MVCVCVMDSGAIGFWDTKTHTCFHQAPLLFEPLSGVALAGDCTFLKRGDERKKRKVRKERREGDGSWLEGGSKKKRGSKLDKVLTMGVLVTGTEKGKISLWQLFFEHPFVSLFYEFELDFPVSSLCTLPTTHHSPSLHVWVSSSLGASAANKTESGGVWVVDIKNPAGSSDPITTTEVEGEKVTTTNVGQTNRSTTINRLTVAFERSIAN